MSKNLRVHIAPVGFEIRRVVEPLTKMLADKVYLVTLGGEDDAAKKFITLIKRDLAQNYEHIKLEEVFVDVWDPYECIAKFREIILKERGNHVYINVSTGTKITAIAGILSCMLWGATPYYARVSYPEPKITDLPRTEHVQEPDVLPVYKINKPRREFLLILSFLKDAGGRLRKVHLIKKLEAVGIIGLRDETKTEFSQSAKHSQLRAILDPMEKEWGFVIVEARGRRSEVSLTEQGQTALKIFGTANELE
jgi:CRISPR locus-related DNA-binding protein